MAEAGDDCGMETSSVSVISEGQARLLHSCEAVEVFTEAVLCWKMVEKDELLVDEDMLELWSSALVLAHLQQWVRPCHYTYMKNLLHHFPTYYAYSVKKPIGELNLKRVLDEDTGPGVFFLFLFFLLLLHWATFVRTYVCMYMLYI